MSSTNGLGDRDAFTKALEAADQLNRALGPLRMDREGTKDRLRSALREPEQEVQAILLLQTLSVELTKALIDIVLEHALRDRYTLLIRNLLGRLAWSEARKSFHRLSGACSIMRPMATTFDAWLNYLTTWASTRLSRSCAYAPVTVSTRMCARSPGTSGGGQRKAGPEWQIE